MEKKPTLNVFPKALVCTLLIFQSFFGLSQTFTKLFDFNGENGSRAYGDLIGDGTYFYGTTTIGGVNNNGVIFKINNDGSNYVKLHDFEDSTGAKPYNGLVRIGEELFGVTLNGGPNDLGIIFKINTNGSNYTVLKDFSNNTDGSFPNASLYFDGTNLYGTTYSGGTGAGGGTIYKLKPDGTDFTTVHNFNGSNTIDGSQPQDKLVFDGTYFYGVTFNGGANSKGVLYKIKPDGTDFIKLYDFDGTNAINNVEPSQILLHDGYLYGCTFLGGLNEYGQIYKIATDGTDFSVLHDFDSPTGAQPHCKLTIAGDFLYGTTTSGGLSSGGTIFKLKPDGTDYQTLFEFVTESGYSCWTSLLYEGNYLYGITTGGGSNNDNGTIFKFDDSLPLEVPDLENARINIFPIPVKDVLHITFSENMDTEVEIYDLTGKLIVKEMIYNNASIPLTNLKSGMYFVQIKNQTYKIIKE